jgi:hypothetical protein
MTLIFIPYLQDLSFIPQDNIRGYLKTALTEINNNHKLYYLFIDDNVVVDYENDAFDPILHSLEHKCENLIRNDKYFYSKKRSTYDSILAMLEYIIIDGFHVFQANYDIFYGTCFSRRELDGYESDHESDNSDSYDSDISVD